MAKQERTAEEIYKSNQKKAKIFRKLTPIVFWVCIAISILCFVLALANSWGNINEIIGKLNSKKYTGEELQANYNALIEKYGEWTIGNGGAGFQIRFINIARACFSGLMMANFALCGIFLILAFLLGKWIFPKTAEILEQNNTDMVNLTILREKDKKDKGE